VQLEDAATLYAALDTHAQADIITEITATGEERKELPSWGKMFKKQ